MTKLILKTMITITILIVGLSSRTLTANDVIYVCVKHLGQDVNSNKEQGQLLGDKIAFIGGEDECPDGWYQLSWNHPPEPIPDPEVQGKIDALQVQISDLQKRLDEIAPIFEKPKLSISDPVPMKEYYKDQTMTFVVSLNRSTQFYDVRFKFETVAGSAEENINYIPTSDYITIPAGETTATISVTIKADNQVTSFHPQFSVKLTEIEGAEVVQDTAVGKIINTDYPRITNGQYFYGYEGESLTLTFTLSEPYFESISMDYIVKGRDTLYVENQPAQTNIFMDEPNGNLTFAPGETEKSITVNVYEDDIVQAYSGGTIKLFNGVNIGNITIKYFGITIYDNDVKLTEMPINSTVSEYLAPYGYDRIGTFKTDAPNDVYGNQKNISIEYRLDYGSGEGYADTDDFSISYGALNTCSNCYSILTNNSISFKGIDDQNVEGDETFDIVIYKVNHFDVPEQRFTVTIIDDD